MYHWARAGSDKNWIGHPVERLNVTHGVWGVSREIDVPMVVRPSTTYRMVNPRKHKGGACCRELPLLCSTRLLQSTKWPDNGSIKDFSSGHRICGHILRSFEAAEPLGSCCKIILVHRNGYQGRCKALEEGIENCLAGPFVGVRISSEAVYVGAPHTWTGIRERWT